MALADLYPVRPPVLPERPAGAVDDETRAMHEAIDDEFARIRELHRSECGRQNLEPLTIACGSGCAACCTVPVSVADGEAHLLASVVQRMPRKRREATLARLAAWERDWRAFAVRQPPMADTDDEKRMAGRWGIRRAACPFLETDTHLCGVYLDRPSMCRTHHAAGYPSDAANRPSFRDPGSNPPRPPPDGCFTTEADLADGGVAPVWQIADHRLFAARPLAAVTELARRQGFGAGITPDPLPLRVLAFGRKRFGWQASAGRTETPTVRRSLAPTEGR